MNRLDLCDYFVELKSQVDFVYAKRQLLDKDKNKNARASLAWLETIDKIETIEKKCLKNSKLFNQITILFDSNAIKLVILNDQHISKETINLFKNKRYILFISTYTKYLYFI